MYTADKIDTILTLNDHSEVFIKLKPYAIEFLDDMISKYELIAYSSLSNDYLIPIIQYLEKKKKYFTYCFYESFCLFANVLSGIKSINFMSKLTPLTNIVVIENSVKTLPLNPFNVVPCNCSENDHLIILGVILNKLIQEEDVISAIKSYKEKI